MNKLILSLILFSTIFLYGCSFNTPFVVENQSSKSIIVRYEAQRLIFDVPKYVNLTNTKSNYDKWQELPQNNYTIDEKTMIVEVILPPMTAVRVQDVDPYIINREPYWDQCKIKMLEIIGENGSIKFEGNQVFEQFQPQKLKWILFGPDVKAYVIYYKESEKKYDTTREN